MSRKEKFARFIAGTILFIPIYASGMYFIVEGEIDWLQTIIISVFWSAGMIVFENWWQQRNTGSDEAKSS